MDALGFVLVGGGDDFDDLVPREFELGDLHSADVHEVGVEHAQHALVCNNKQVVLLALQLQNDRLKPDSQVMVRLGENVRISKCLQEVTM